MVKILLSDRLLQILLLILAVILAAWVWDLIIYPFGLLILASVILARVFHLLGKTSASANPEKIGHV